jgi:hypothetical protein
LPSVLIPPENVAIETLLAFVPGFAGEDQAVNGVVDVEGSADDADDAAASAGGLAADGHGAVAVSVPPSTDMSPLEVVGADVRGADRCPCHVWKAEAVVERRVSGGAIALNGDVGWRRRSRR